MAECTPVTPIKRTYLLKLSWPEATALYGLLTRCAKGPDLAAVHQAMHQAMNATELGIAEVSDRKICIGDHVEINTYSDSHARVRGTVVRTSTLKSPHAKLRMDSGGGYWLFNPSTAYVTFLDEV